MSATASLAGQATTVGVRVLQDPGEPTAVRYVTVVIVQPVTLCLADVHVHLVGLDFIVISNVRLVTMALVVNFGACALMVPPVITCLVHVSVQQDGQELRVVKSVPMVSMVLVVHEAVTVSMVKVHVIR